MSETSAEVLEGLIKAFRDYDTKKRKRLALTINGEATPPSGRNRQLQISCSSSGTRFPFASRSTRRSHRGGVPLIRR